MVLHFDMECLPDEIIGEILSRISNAREVVVASTTCKKWRRAMLFHLKSLTYFSNDFSNLGRDIEIDRLEMIIHQTILQTKGLESVFLHDEDVVFSAAHVFSWLMHTQHTLRELCLYVNVSPGINIFQRLKWCRLEVLGLAHVFFPGDKLSDMTSIPCLKTLLLYDSEFSILDLRNLIALCPNIENLFIINLDLGAGATLELSIGTLKKIEVEYMKLDKFQLESDRLESLQLIGCDFQLLKVVGNKALKVLSFDDSRVSYFDVGENIENLENVDVKNSTFKGLMLYRMISTSSNLKRLRVLPVTYESNCYGITDLKKISISFPQLTYLSLKYTEQVDLCLQDSFLLQKVAVLELGFSSSQHFSDRIGGFIARCPSLKKMVVYMLNCKDRHGEHLGFFEEFSSSIVHVERKYPHVEFAFNYQ